MRRLTCFSGSAWTSNGREVDQQFELIQKVHRQGTTVFIVEQNARMALSIADRGYVLQTGSIVLADTARNLLNNEMMQKAYLGEAT
jgi:branched-chain amino acid transport system ATP-binding protein